MFFWRWFLISSIIYGFGAMARAQETRPTLKPTPNFSEIAANLSTKGTMKGHFHKGMRFYTEHHYNKAIPELIAATMIVDPFTWNYWYAEAYATLGIIYEFHITEPGHSDIARQYYSLALKRDPQTKSAKYFLGKIGSKGKSK